MFLVGVTGGIASGKSTVSKIFRELGCPIVDADLIAREVVQPGTAAWRKIMDEFGPAVFLADGRIHREKLGQIIFQDESKRMTLNKITHPEIQKAIMWKLSGYLLKGHQFVILDIPLLFESGKMLPYMSYTVVVACSEEQQLSRLQQRNGYSEEEARQRIQAQIPLVEKCAKATYIIDNSGNMDDTKQQVMDIYRKLCSSKLHWRLRFGVVAFLTLISTVIAYFVSK